MADIKVEGQNIPEVIQGTMTINEYVKEKGNELLWFYDELKDKVKEGTNGMVSFFDTLAQDQSVRDTASSILSAAAALTALSSAALDLKNAGIGDLIGVKSIQTTNQEITTLANKLGEIPLIGDVAKSALDKMLKLKAPIDFSNQLEASVTQMKSKSTEFGGLESRFSLSPTTIENDVAKYLSSVRDIRIATNVGKEEAVSYITQISQIPKAYSQVYQSNAFAGGIDLTTAAIKTAQGTTGDFKDSIENLNYVYEQFGKDSLPLGIDLLSQTYEVSQKLGVKFEDINYGIKDITTSFASFGNNSSSATNLVLNLNKAFMETGIGVKQSMSMIQGITSSISNLNQAQKSFMSSQTGGSGGLRGAFEIDKLLSEGKLSEVYQKMQESISKQMGGRIVSLDEASSNENSAAQFERQIQMLTSGPFGSIIKDRGQAMKYLQAMSSGIGSEEILGSDTTSTAMNIADQDNIRRGGTINRQLATYQHAMDIGSYNFGIKERSVANGDSAQSTMRDEMNEAVSRLRSSSQQVTDLGDELFGSLGILFTNLKDAAANLAADGLTKTGDVKERYSATTSTTKPGTSGTATSGKSGYTPDARSIQLVSSEPVTIKLKVEMVNGQAIATPVNQDYQATVGVNSN